MSSILQAIQGKLIYDVFMYYNIAIVIVKCTSIYGNTLCVIHPVWPRRWEIFRSKHHPNISSFLLNWWFPFPAPVLWICEIAHFQSFFWVSRKNKPKPGYKKPPSYGRRNLTLMFFPGAIRVGYASGFSPSPQTERGVFWQQKWIAYSCPPNPSVS